jgi:hypothetical protein
VFSRPDKLYDQLRKWLSEANFEKVEVALDSLKLEEYSADMLLSYLTITAPYKASLSRRASFVQVVQQELVKRGHYRPELMEGLV